MKKVMLTIVAILLVVVASGVTAYAVTYLPKTENIFNISNVDACDRGFGTTRCSTASTFKHNGNRCYVLINRDNQPTSISCVRFEEEYKRGE